MKSITHPTFLQLAFREKAAPLAALAARLSFAVTIVLVPFRLRLVLLARPVPPVISDYTDFLLFASDAAVLLALVFWSASMLISPRRLSLGPRAVWIPLAALTAIGAASVGVSYDPSLSAYHALRLLILFWFYVFIVNEIRSINWIVVSVTIQVIVQSVVALAQFMAQRSLGLQPLGEMQLDPSQSGVGIVVANGVRLLRAYGLTDHPNILGGCLAFGLVLLLGVYLHGSWRPAILAAFAVGAPALLVTFSRAAWLAFFAGCAFILAAEFAHCRWESLKSLAFLLPVPFVLVASIFLSYSGFFGARVDVGNSFGSPTIEEQAIGERAILIQASLPLLVQHAPLGVGLGASPVALQHTYPAFDVPYAPPHLTVLDAALEIGIPGALAYLVLVLAPFVMYVRRRRDLITDRFATVSVAILLSIVVVGFFDYYTWLLTAGRLWQWLAWGIWTLASVQQPSFQLEPHRLAAQRAEVPV